MKFMPLQTTVIILHGSCTKLLGWGTVGPNNTASWSCVVIELWKIYNLRIWVKKFSLKQATFHWGFFISVSALNAFYLLEVILQLCLLFMWNFYYYYYYYSVKYAYNPVSMSGRFCYKYRDTLIWVFLVWNSSRIDPHTYTQCSVLLYCTMYTFSCLILTWRQQFLILMNPL